MLWWSWALSAAGILSLWIAGRGQWYGWAFGLATQFPWAYYSVVTGQYGFLASSAAYGWVYGSNAVRWYRNRPAPAAVPGDDGRHGRGAAAAGLARQGAAGVHRVRGAARRRGVRVEGAPASP